MEDQKMKDQKRWKNGNTGRKMRDQMSGVDFAGSENAGPENQDRKMEDQRPEAGYLI